MQAEVSESRGGFYDEDIDDSRQRAEAGDDYDEY